MVCSEKGERAVTNVAEDDELLPSPETANPWVSASLLEPEPKHTFYTG